MASETILELKHVTKRFGEVVANDGVDLSLKRGEILSILGENGSGKTTLMNILSGIYYPDDGEVCIDGKTVSIRSPQDAFDLGIGMVHQHFKLIKIMTAAENIILGMEGEARLHMQQVEENVRKVVSEYGFDLNPKEKIYNMSVSQKQTVEIVKVLYRGARILILDEPTAVLTPQETEKLFAVMRNMKAAGKSIIIITHKLNEVLEISDRVSVLRKGKYIGTVDTKDASVDSLTEMMVGEKVELDFGREDPVSPERRIEMEHVTVTGADGRNVLTDISFTANSGEILGIAGISGNGQKELLESIAGLQVLQSGEINYYPPDAEKTSLTGKSVEEIRKMGISLSFVPEDRLGMGLVGSMDMTDNMMLRSFRKGRSFFANRKDPKDLAERIIKQLEVVTPGTATPVRRLSGGNVQKVLVGREISISPRVLMTAYPVRGLDINSSYTIYHLLNEQKKNGAAVICVGEDLDVLIGLCDRILVLAGGRVSGIVDARHVTKEEIGLLMTGMSKEMTTSKEEVTS
ncbi:MAG: ABC transporter ATP-binding protein [Lachnospiraceae bacterium]|nr:ABC transporter ATP-binding protein [Lachnospiraceae bacterium]